MKNICIHGHFYQPPREDPISDVIPDEAGSQPYNNWNSKILAECYQPNALLGNFGKISFNIGPTLFNWLVKESPDIASLIIKQENENYKKYGVGNGMAQGYNHIILPLASRRDKITQIKWGIKDFETKFNHKPEGFWLPETAVDEETLSILAGLGIKFTILAPWQAHPSDVDVSKPYKVMLGSGDKEINIFFYQRELSTSLSFNPKSSENADSFLNMVNTLDNHDTNIYTIASDGELYGHHQPFRDLFLNYLVNEGAIKNNIKITFPGLWLKENPVNQYTQIYNNTSWSCHHGVLRWSKGCDCTNFSEWKYFLWFAFQKISKQLDEIFENYLGQLSLSCWHLRNEYIDVLNGIISNRELILRSTNKNIDESDIEKVSLLLRSQYERQRMFTSCGWFFEDFHRIEPQNNIAYCAMAVWLAESVTGLNLSDLCLELLSKVVSRKSGLRGDIVFSQTWLRAKDMININKN